MEQIVADKIKELELRELVELLETIRRQDRDAFSLIKECVDDLSL